LKPDKAEMKGMITLHNRYLPVLTERKRMIDKNKEIIKWFSNVGNRYVDNILSIVEIEKLKQDQDYANKMFFYYWAFERQGAPMGYKIAAIKTLETVKNGNYSTEFSTYYKGKPNKRNNPILDERIGNLNIAEIVCKIEQKKFEEAFNDLSLNGIGHKIRAFFIRDIVHLLKLEGKNKIKFDDYLFMNPIDVWVRLTVEYLNLNFPVNITLNPNKYHIEKKDFNTALILTNTCMEFNLSPLLTNMGIWYYASHFIADSNRLKLLLESKSVEKLENEMKLMKGFSEFKRVLIE